MAVSLINQKLLFSVAPKILRPLYSHNINYPLQNVYQYRFYSPKSNSESLPNASFLEEPPTVITDAVKELNSLGEPTLSSLGLCSYTPSGLVQYLMESAHVHLDMPWWMAICATCFTFRLCMMPISLAIRRGQINMSNNLPTMQLMESQLQDALDRKDHKAYMRIQNNKMEFMQRNGMGFSFFKPIFFQGVIFVSYFWGLEAMTSLPVESMKTGGVLSFVDLTIPEPYYLLPLLTGGSILFILETGAEGMKMDMFTKNIKYLARGCTVLGIFFMAQFPSALTLYWFTSNMISLTQSLLFRQKAVRKILNIPETVEHDEEFLERTRNLQNKAFSLQRMKDLHELLQAEDAKHQLAQLKEKQMKLKNSNIVSYDDSTIKSKPKLSNEEKSEKQERK